MAAKCRCWCVFPWLSGFFALPAIVHLIRIIAGWELVWGGEAVTMKTSWIIFIVCALFSLVLGIIGCLLHKKEAPGVC